MFREESYASTLDPINLPQRIWEVCGAQPLLSGRIGETFDALVTGASEKGTWVRLLKPPGEGKLVSGQEGVKVGDPLKVRLASLNVARGFIDFVCSGQ